MKKIFSKKYVAAFILIGAFFLSAFPVHARVTMTGHNLYAYETPEKIMTGAVFGVYQPNIDGENIKLVGVKSELICKHAEIHNMVDDNGIMRMRKVDALPLDGFGRVVLEPTGYHIMLMNLTVPLKEGDIFPLTFVFSNGEEEMVRVPVRKRVQGKRHD